MCARIQTPASCADTIRLLVELGFDVKARSRTTALHEAALRGHMTIIKLLVELGADPTIADTEFDSTPSGWADHAGHADAAEYLEQLAVSRPAIGSPPTISERSSPQRPDASPPSSET